MAKKYTLEAETRNEKNGKAKALRRNGLVPGILYGSKTENINLKIKQLALEKVYTQAGESNLVDLEIDKKEPTKVIIKAIDRDPVRSTVTHVDFYQVDMNKPIEVEIPLNFINESRAVKEEGGTLMKNLESFSAKCLPGALIDGVDIDISVLGTFDDQIKVEDIKLPEGIEILNAPEELVANVAEVQEEVEEEVPAEGGEVAEGEEAAEGAEKKEDGGDDKAEKKEAGGKKEEKK